MTKATNSCSRDAYGDRLRLGFFVFEAVREDTESSDLSLGHGFISRGAIGQNARKFRDLGDPTAVFFALVLDSESRHWVTVRSAPKLPPNVEVCGAPRARRVNERRRLLAARPAPPPS